jgi:hypothetical protein
MSKIFKIILIISICIGVFSSAPSVFALSVSTNISEKYTEIQAGERLYFEVDIKYPENPQRKDLQLNYEVTKDNVVIAQSKVLKAIETQAQFLDFIVIPASSKTGLYNLNVKISDYGELNDEVSTSFNVVGGGDQQLKTYFFILLGVISLVAVLVIINIFVSRKRKVTLTN